MLKFAGFGLILGMTALGAANAQSLQDQISAVNRVQEQRLQAEKAANEAEAREQQLREQEQRRLAQQKAAAEAKRVAVKAELERKAVEQRLALERDAAERKRAQEEARRSEELADKYRDHNFEDELRQLQIEERRLALEEKRARVKRTDDYIDQELKREAARTEVIQSEADATRNVSSGAGDLLRSEGKAREAEASRIFR